MKKFYLFALICLLMTDVMGEQSVVSLRTLLLGSGEKIPELWVRVKGQPNPVKLAWPDTQPSEGLNVIHDGHLNLMHSSKFPEGNMLPEASTPVSLPGSAEEVLLLAIADADGVEYRAIEDTFMEAIFNDWLAINISEQAVKVKAGAEKKGSRIDAGASVIFRPAVEVGAGFKVIAEAEHKGKLKPFFSSYWPTISGQRSIIIFYRDGERMRARRIADHFNRLE